MNTHLDKVSDPKVEGSVTDELSTDEVSLPPGHRIRLDRIPGEKA